jgi:xylose dehydrogenase (NAD/NADP)
MIKWGLLGAGWIAHAAIADAVHAAENATLYAVATREPTRGYSLRPTKVFSRYQDLLDDPEVDAVYISLPNHLHYEWTLKALNCGKHVLCEKPFALNHEQAVQMFAAAQNNGVTLSEALWTLWHPRFLRVIELAKTGQIGDILAIDSAFTFLASLKGNYRSSPEMGGGSLLDVGPYQLHLWSAIFQGNALLEINSKVKTIGPTAVDLTTEIKGALHQGIKVCALTSFEMPELQRLEITGSEGILRITDDQPFTSWKQPSSLSIGNTQEKFAPVDAYVLMIESFSRSAQLNLPHHILPAQSLNVMALLDQITLMATTTEAATTVSSKGTQPNN